MAAANNPRKFSEKIALHNQKQAEETAAFEEVMMELTNSRLQAQKVHQLRLSQTRGQYYGGSLPNVNAISSNAIADFQGPFNLGLDSNRGTRHHGLVERVQIARLTSPHRRQVDSSPYSSAYLALPPDSSWRRNALPWCNFPAEKGNRFGLTSALSRTNSDSALHTSVSHPSAAAAAPYPNVGPTPLGQNKKSAFSTSALPLDEFQDEDKTLSKAPWDTHKVQSSLSRPKSCEMPGLNKGGLLFPEAGTLFGQEGVEETMAWSPPAQLRDDAWRRVNKMSIFSSPDGSGGGPHVSGGLNTGGSLPDLTNLHFPSPLPTPLDPEEAAFGIAGGNSTGNLGLGRSPRGNTDYRPAGLSSSLQGSLSNMSLQSSLSNPSLHSSLGASSLQPSLSNPSLGPKAGPVGASPRRRAAPINPLVLSAADSRRGHAKQFSPTMSPTLSSIAQGIPLDTSSLSDQRLPPYPFCQQQAFQQTGYPQSQPTQQTAFPQSQSTQFPPSSHSSHQTGYSQSQSPQQTTFPPSQSQQTAFPQSQSQQTGYSQSQSSQQAAFQQSQSQQTGYSQSQSQQTAFPQAQSSHPTQLSPSQSAQQTTFPQSQSNQQIVYPPSQSHQTAFPQSQSSQQTVFPQSQQNQQRPFPQSQSAQQTAFPKSQSSHQTQFPQSQQNQQTAFPQSQSSQQTAFPQSQSQQTAFPQSQSSQQTVFPKSQSSHQTQFPQSQQNQQTAFPQSQQNQQTAFPQSQSSQQTAFPQSQSQQTAFPQSQSSQQTVFPQSQSQQTAFPQSQQNQQTAFPQSQSQQTAFPQSQQNQQTGHHQTGYQQPQLDYQQELFQQNYPQQQQQQQPSSQTALSYKVPAGERLQEGPCPPGAPLLNKHNLFYCSRVGPIPNIILTGDSPPGLSKEIATALSGMPGFEMEPHYPLDEGLVEPLTLASLSMLSDPDLNLLSDPDLEDGFRADRL